MPEGDIVARVARRLNEALAGRPLTRGELRWPTLGAVDLAGVTVTEHVSVGKHLLTRLGPDADAPVVPYSLAGRLSAAPELNAHEPGALTRPVPTP